MTALLVLSFWRKKRWMLWALIAGTVGFIAEWIGVHTGALFGRYQYGTALGPAIDSIPLLIAANWIIVVSGASSLAQGFSKNKLAVPILAALFATACDWLLEPVAIRLGWWSWEGGAIPFYNYVCWAGLSILLSALWMALKIRPGSFAVILFLIQCMFFALLRLAF
jgi:putative membrane protein